MHVLLSAHADKRLKERLGLPRKARRRMAQKAYDVGTASWTLPLRDKLRLWIEAKTQEQNEHGPVEGRVHGRFVWIFSMDGTLVTVIPLPGWL